MAARPVGALGRTWRWGRRNPAVASLLGAVAATLLLGIVVSTALAVWALANARQAKANADQADANAARAGIKEAEARREAWEKEKQRLKAEAQKRLAEHRLFTSQLYRVEAVHRSDPALGWALLHDEDYCPTKDRDFVWGLYNRRCQRERATLRGHTGAVYAAAYSPDGNTPASGSADRTVKLWDAVTGRERAP